MEKLTKNHLTIPADYLVDKRFLEDSTSSVLPRPTYPIANIEPPIEWMRYCSICDKETEFIADRVCLSGLVGNCLGCGDERISPYSRMNSDV
jgi:hypothetical protein